MTRERRKEKGRNGEGEMIKCSHLSFTFFITKHLQENNDGREHSSRSSRSRSTREYRRSTIRNSTSLKVYSLQDVAIMMFPPSTLALFSDQFGLVTFVELTDTPILTFDLSGAPCYCSTGAGSEKSSSHQKPNTTTSNSTYIKSSRYVDDDTIDKDDDSGEEADRDVDELFEELENDDYHMASFREQRIEELKEE